MSKIMTISQAAEYAQVSTTTIRRAIKSEQLPAEKQIGQFGPEYHILLSDLEKWIAQRPRQEKSEEGADQGNKIGVEQEQGYHLVPLTMVNELQDKLQGAIYRAGQAEGQTQILTDEITRLREEREREREQLIARIRELENNVIEQQREIIENIEKRDKAFLDFVKSWREAASTAREEEKKPWWKFW